MVNTEFPPWPSFTREEADAVSAVLLSNKVNYWTGEKCQAFERAFASLIGTGHAVALSNGTVALELALKALGIGAGDEVVVTPRTFVASASSIVNVGAAPVFADVDRDTQNITAETIAKVLTPRTRAITCVHLAGMPCDMDPIMALAASRGIAVVEDCAQAHGARYKGRSVGSLGNVGAWSFCQDKILTTGGEGGMVTTSDDELSSRMWSLKDHGKNVKAMFEREHQVQFRWLHETFGTNARMLEIQAAIGHIQIGRLAAWTQIRRRHAERIWLVARTLNGLRAPVLPNWAEHAGYRCYVFIEPDQLASGWDRDRIIDSLQQQGIPCNSGTCPEVYLEKAFDGTGWRPERRLPVARNLGQTSIAFLVHPTLTDAHIDRTCEVLTDVMRRAQR